jgi:signal peptidase II
MSGERDVADRSDDHESTDTAAVDASPSRRRLPSPQIAPLSVAVAAAFVLVDQLSKHWAVNALADGDERHVVWTLQWNLAFNSGMAFSRGEGLGPVIALLALLVVVVLVVSSARVGGRLARVAAGMLIGGAAGNLVDRVFRGDGWLHGSVVDFIDVQWWPIFNVADVGVTVGAVLFLLASLRPEPSVGVA